MHFAFQRSRFSSDLTSNERSELCGFENFSSSSTGNPDILICGNCREMFSELSDLLDHKRSYCKLRFTCKCQEQLPTIINSKTSRDSATTLQPLNVRSSLSFAENLYPSSKLLCVVCKDSFSNPWDLMVHAQAAHMVNIYEIGESDEEDDSNTSSKSNKLDKTNGESHNNGSSNLNGSSCNGTVMHSNENVSRLACFLMPFLSLSYSLSPVLLKYLCIKNFRFSTKKGIFMARRATKIL
jgi:hypothetical protein